MGGRAPAGAPPYLTVRLPVEYRGPNLWRCWWHQPRVTTVAARSRGFRDCCHGMSGGRRRAEAILDAPPHSLCRGCRALPGDGHPAGGEQRLHKTWWIWPPPGHLAPIARPPAPPSVPRGYSSSGIFVLVAGRTVWVSADLFGVRAGMSSQIQALQRHRCLIMGVIGVALAQLMLFARRNGSLSARLPWA